MGNNGSLAIGSHSETMVAEEKNISNSKVELENTYNNYLEDNQALVLDWQGDTADIFAKYSDNMNNMLNASIGTTSTFGVNVNTFYSESQVLDTQASMNADGGK